ncbi:MAG: transposase [Alphaproteobacteria bacterium]|nr:transposase [Alphaproteobacteria bacterium]
MILPNVNTDMLNLYLQEMSRQFADDKISLVMDGAGWHRSRQLNLPANISIIHLPPYSPELNPVERFWQQLKRITIRNKIYDSIDELEVAVCAAIHDFTPEQIAQICGIN